MPRRNRNVRKRGLGQRKPFELYRPTGLRSSNDPSRIANADPATNRPGALDSSGSTRSTGEPAWSGQSVPNAFRRWCAGCGVAQWPVTPGRWLCSCGHQNSQIRPPV
jgi:hypothetical protein